MALYMDHMFNGVPYREGEYFRFPLTVDGIRSFRSIHQLQYTFRRLFEENYGHSKVIKWTMYCTRINITCAFKLKIGKITQMWKLRCKICTNTITYGKKGEGQPLTLLNINYEHLHITDLNRYLQMIRFNKSYRITVQQFKLFGNSFFRGGTSEQMLLEFLERLPSNILRKTKYEIMRNQFGISEEYFSILSRQLNKKFEVPFSQILKIFEERQYKCRYLPKDLIGQRAHHYEDSLRPQEIPNEKNPKLPNVLLVVTPAMIDLYKRYGQWVGFDLTFSIISERTEDNGEYMLGIFASTNNSKKIVVFGLVVTNSQSVFAYKYLFKSFIEIMGSSPQIIITDEEKAMLYALKELKREGIFTGTQLLDMFHILRKFRKFTTDKQTFPLIRQLIHAKNRFQYRKIMRKLMKNVTNDKEVDLLRNFDLHSQKYCYSQAVSKYVGKGISNNVNQFFHSMIKDQIPYSIKFIRAITTILALIERKAEELGEVPSVAYLPFDTTLNMPQLKKYKYISSSKLFEFVIKQVSMSPHLKIMNIEEESEKNLKPPIEDESLYELKNRDHFYLVSQEGYIFYVFKTTDNSQTLGGKWSCLCGFEGKAGHLCCHIAKVVLRIEEDFFANINKRWFMSTELIQSCLQSEKNVLKLRKKFEKKLIDERIRLMMNFKRNPSIIEDAEETRSGGSNKKDIQNKVEQVSTVEEGFTPCNESNNFERQKLKRTLVISEKPLSTPLDVHLQKKVESFLTNPRNQDSVIQIQPKQKKMTKRPQPVNLVLLNGNQKWFFKTSHRQI